MSFLPIQRTQPLEVRDPFMELQNDVSQLFNRLSRLWADDGIFSDRPLTTPTMDIEEDDKNFYIRLRNAEHHKESRRSFTTERIYGRFYREIMLPVEADVDRLHASLKHGVLTVTMPKSANTIRRSIPIDNT
ncbi:MAG: heat-shock protein Hsp20 [Sulfobacillus benefaciens]|uniref:Heat-shock protein Hsp20 n=1 Tax=Sulfobacillus benefaciens TaxID=453960 RepID=A0A2T2X7Q3_9FIRM|nr:MAG: heat-shock protein Hsp20 [Sulfobacillus benefaciens]